MMCMGEHEDVETNGQSRYRCTQDQESDLLLIRVRVAFHINGPEASCGIDLVLQVKAHCVIRFGLDRLVVLVNSLIGLSTGHTDFVLGRARRAIIKLHYQVHELDCAVRDGQRCLIAIITASIGPEIHSSQVTLLDQAQSVQIEE